MLATSDLARQFLDTGDNAAAAMLAAEMTVLGRFDDDRLTPEAQDGPPLRALADLRRGRPVEAALQALPLWRHRSGGADRGRAGLADTLDDELAAAAGNDEAVIQGWIDEALAREPDRDAAEARQTAALEPMMAAFAAGDPVGADAAARAALDQVLADDPVVASAYYALLLATRNAGRPDLATAWAFRLAEMPAGYLASLDNDPVPVLGDIADRLLNVGRAREAADLAGRVLDLAALRDGPGAASVRAGLLRLGAALRDLGQFPEAEAALRQSLALALPEGSAPGLDQAQAAVQTLVDLALLAEDRADPEAARAAYSQALGLLDSSPAGAAPEGWSFVLDQYARFTAQSGQPDAALTLATRAVSEISRREVPGERLALALLRQGLIQLDLDRPGDAAATLAAAGTIGGDTAPGDLARIRVARARALDRLGRGDEAAASLATLLTLDAKGGVAALTAILEGASASEAAGDAEVAGRLVAQAVAALPADDPVRAYAEAAQGQLAYRAGDLDTALDAFRAATAALTRRDRRDEPRARDHLALHVRAAEDRAALAAGTEALTYATEAFQVAQRVNDLSAGAALGRATARLLGSGPEAAALARDLESADRRVAAAREALLARLGAGGDAAPARADLAEAREALEALSGRLAREFPDYAAFADPRPVDLLAAARLLAPGEALVLYATSDVAGRDGEPASIAIAIRDGRTVTASLPGRADLAALARDLRCAAALTDRACGGGGGRTRGAFSLEAPAADRADFDYALAYRAYQMLLEPLEEVTEGATSLILVPDRSLAALPFHLLLTAATDPAAPLARAPWLIRRSAITVVPTVAGLAGLRGGARASAGDRPFLGVGDPLIGVERRGALPYDCAAPPPEAGLMAAALAAPEAPILRGGQADGLALAACRRCPIPAANWSALRSCSAPRTRFC